MRKPLVTHEGQTVQQQKAKKLVELIKSGTPTKEAEREAGVSLATLRKNGTLQATVRDAIARAEEAGLLTKEVRERLYKARVMELMMQDDDLKVAAAMTKEVRQELGLGNPALQVQINNVVRDQNVVNALRALGLEDVVDVEKVDDDTSLSSGV